MEIRFGMRLVAKKSLRPLGDFYPVKGETVVVGSYNPVLNRYRMESVSGGSVLLFCLSESQIREYCEAKDGMV